MIKQQTGLLPAVSALGLNSVLTKLTLESVDAGGIAKLAGLLCELSTLKTLELMGCWFGSRGAKYLGKCNSGFIMNALDTELIAVSIL